MSKENYLILKLFLKIIYIYLEVKIFNKLKHTINNFGRF